MAVGRGRHRISRNVEIREGNQLLVSAGSRCLLAQPGEGRGTAGAGTATGGCHEDIGFRAALPKGSDTLLLGGTPASKDGVGWSRIRPVKVSAPHGRQAAEQCFSWGSGSCSPSLQILCIPSCVPIVCQLPACCCTALGAQGGGDLREEAQEQGAAWGEGAAVGTAHRAAKSKGLSSAGGELKLLLVSVQVLQSHLSSCSLSLSQLVILVSFSSKGYYSM